MVHQRWTGHLLTIRAILKNYQELLSLLRRCASSMNTAEISIKACGLLAHVGSLLFALLTCLLNDLLSRIEPANNALQSTNHGVPETTFSQKKFSNNSVCFACFYIRCECKN
jgi:hypothetical protein